MIADGLEDLQGLVAEFLVVAAIDIVDADKKGIIHDLEMFQQFNVTLELFDEGAALLVAAFDVAMASDPIEVFHGAPRVLLEIFLAEVAADGGTF